MTSSLERILFRACAAIMLGLAQMASAIEADAPVLVSHTPDGQPTTGICYGPRLSHTGRFTSFSCMAFDVIYGEPGVGDALLHDDQDDSIIGLSYTDQGEWGHCNGGELGACSSGSIAVSDDGSLAVLNSSAPLTEDSPHPTPDHGFPNVYLRDTVDQTTTWLTPPMPPLPTYNTPRALDASMERSEILMRAQNNYTGDPDTNGDTPDVFALNWETGEAELISATPNGQQGEGGGGTGAFSPDGRYVVFGTSASDLTNDNPQRLHNLFLRDRVTQTTRRLTFPWNGGEFTAQPYFSPQLKITRDNRYVVFSAAGVRFTEDDDPVYGGIYEIDLQTGTTRKIPLTASGDPPNAPAGRPALSEDGRFLAFLSSATNLTNEPGPVPAVFVQDRWTGETVNVSASLGTQPSDWSTNIAISADGSTVAFEWAKWSATNPNLLSNQQIYKVRLRGDPPPAQAVPVPTHSHSMLGVLAALLGIGSMLLLRSRRTH